MDSADALFARLALSRGWIRVGEHDRVLERVAELRQRGLAKTAEDVLRESGSLDAEKLRVLRRLVSRYTQTARVGDYHLVRRIGVGGTGMVFEGQHRRMGRRAAIKILFPRLEKERGFAERFLREASVLARIDHPAVVHAYDAGRDGDFYYIATEMVEGVDLAQLLEAEGPMSIERSSSIVRQLCGALGAIHRAGLVHRDVKPANVLLARDGAVKLADLGLYFSEREPQVFWDGRVFGTPQYMSPEQIRGDETIDTRADLYSLGATWYHLLTGRPMFPRGASREVARAQLNEEPTPPGEFRRELPRELEALVLALLRKDPARRPASTGEVLQVLDAVEAPGATSAGGPLPDRPGDARTRGTTRRFALLTAVGLLFTIAGAALGLHLTGHLGSASDDAPAASGQEVIDDRAGAGAVSSAGSATGSPKGTSSPRRRAADVDIESLAVDAEGRESLSRTLTTAARTVRAVAETLLELSRLRRDDDSAASESQALAGGPDRGAPPADEPPLPPEIASWSREAAARTRSRALRRLAAREGEAAFVEVLVRADDTPPRVRARLESRDGRAVFVTERAVATFDMEEVHPATWIAWGGLGGEARAELSDAVGLALAQRELSLAVWLAGRQELELPPAVMRHIEAQRARAEPLALATSEYLTRALSGIHFEEQARASLRNGQWEAAARTFEALLGGEDFPASFLRRTDAWQRGLRRARELEVLTSRFFHGEVEVLSPLVDTTLRLRYSFGGAGELRDFRLAAAAWTLRHGRLVRSASRGLERIDTVAIFTTPLGVELVWTPHSGQDRADLSGKVVVWFGDRGFGVGAAGAPIASFVQGDEEHRAFLGAAAAAGPGRVRIELERDRFAVELPGGVAIETTSRRPAPEFGRVGIDLGPHAGLESLSITGRTEPRWRRARIAVMRASEEPAVK